MRGLLESQARLCVQALTGAANNSLQVTLQQAVLELTATAGPSSSTGISFALLSGRLRGVNYVCMQS